ELANRWHAKSSAFLCKPVKFKTSSRPQKSPRSTGTKGELTDLKGKGQEGLLKSNPDAGGLRLKQVMSITYNKGNSPPPKKNDSLTGIGIPLSIPDLQGATIQHQVTKGIEMGRSLSFQGHFGPIPCRPPAGSILFNAPVPLQDPAKRL
ncbi:MAG: hypothetical protein KC931_07140, partial [Candidatus Omnitrophica bacterium]|nr:hypothetical protein [Candidatus Omnitrophota bacterium]